MSSQLRCGLPIQICLGVLVLWGSLFLALVPTWRHGLYYEFGWLVPPAALVFARVRIGQLPAGSGSGSRPRLVWWLSFVCVFTAGLLVVRALEYVDPTWRRALLPHAALAAIGTLGMICFAYGWRVAGFFLPVVLFALTAVPLPSRIEIPMVQHFTEVVIVSAAEVLRLLGTPIRVSGSLLSSMGNTVEVVEGCSGLRSLQSLFMAAMFFGELYQLRLAVRLGLIVAGTAVGFVINVVRVIILAQLKLGDGQAAFDRWHDAVGLAAFVLGIGILFLIALLCERRSTGQGAKPPVMGIARAQGGGRKVAIGVAGMMVALVGVEAAAGLWFLPGGQTSLAVRAPEYQIRAGASVTELDLANNAASKVLQYDEGKWLQVRGRDGLPRSIEFFAFRFEPDNPGYFNQVLGHRVEACMGRFRIEEEFPHREVQLHSGQRMRFRSLQFTAAGGYPAFVFKSQWIGGHGSIASPDPTGYRIRAAKERRQRLSGPAVVYMAMVTGCQTEHEAWRFFVGEMFSVDVD